MWERDLIQVKHPAVHSDESLIKLVLSSGSSTDSPTFLRSYNLLAKIRCCKGGLTHVYR